MSAEEKIRILQSKLDMAAREQDARSALAERRLADTAEKARESFHKQVDVAARYAEHMKELNKRKEESGGWVTRRSTADRDNAGVMDVGSNEEFHLERPEMSEPKHTRENAEGQEAVEVEQESLEVSITDLPERPAESADAQQVDGRPQAADPAHLAEQMRTGSQQARSRGRHARPDDDFDDEDFSSRSWLR